MGDRIGISVSYLSCLSEKGFLVVLENTGEAVATCRVGDNEEVGEARG